jgi:hypothetical protein
MLVGTIHLGGPEANGRFHGVYVERRSYGGWQPNRALVPVVGRIFLARDSAAWGDL